MVSWSEVEWLHPVDQKWKDKQAIQRNNRGHPLFITVTLMPGPSSLREEWFVTRKLGSEDA